MEEVDEEVDNIMCSVFGVPGYSSTDSDGDINVAVNTYHMLEIGLL